MTSPSPGGVGCISCFMQLYSTLSSVLYPTWSPGVHQLLWQQRVTEAGTFKPKLSVLCWLLTEPWLCSGASSWTCLEPNLPSVCRAGGTLLSAAELSCCYPRLWMLCSCLRGFHGVPGAVSCGFGRSGSLTSLCNSGWQGAEQSSRAENHTNPFSKGWHGAPPGKELEFSPQSGCLASQISPWTLFIANWYQWPSFYSISLPYFCL